MKLFSYHEMISDCACWAKCSVSNEGWRWHSSGKVISSITFTFTFYNIFCNHFHFCCNHFHFSFNKHICLISFHFWRAIAIFRTDLSGGCLVEGRKEANYQVQHSPQVTNLPKKRLGYNSHQVTTLTQPRSQNCFRSWLTLEELLDLSGKGEIHVLSNSRNLSVSFFHFIILLLFQMGHVLLSTYWNRCFQPKVILQSLTDLVLVSDLAFLWLASNAE